MSHCPTAYLDLTALHYNVAQLKKIAPNSRILAMVKSDGYGHGIERVSQTLATVVDGFGVSCLEEALKIKAIANGKVIVICKGFYCRDELNVIDHEGFETVIHNQHQIDILQKISLCNQLKVWLKVDTGMHRLGFAAEAAVKVYQQLLVNEKIAKPLRLMTHFAESGVENLKTKRQMACFEQAIAGLSGEKCLANSAAIMQWSGTRTDWIRPGISLYGISPILDETVEKITLRPVLTLTSRLMAIHNLKKGEAVGYGSTWVCPEDMSVGIVSIGYGDGYPRSAKTGTPVLINGVRCPLIGTVAMDMINVDLRLCPTAKLGDEVTLWGRGLPAEEVATFADTIPYVLNCGLTSRVRKICGQTPYNENEPATSRKNLGHC